MGLAAALVAVGIGAVAALLARRHQGRFLRAGGPELRPEGQTPVVSAAPAATVAVRLGGFEAWKLLLHPVFLVGLALSAALFLGDASGTTDLSSADADSGVVLVPLAWAAMVTANLAALRSRRDGVDELYDSLPTSRTERTAGHLLSGFGALGSGMVVLVVTIAVELLFRDAFGTPNLGMLVVGPLIILGGCFLGVLAARWVPSAIVGVLLVVGTFVAEGVTGSSGTSPARWLQFWVQVIGEDGGHPFPGPSDWHVLYLVGLVGIGAAVALARYGLTRAVAGLGMVALLAAGVAGWAQTRMPSAAEARRQVAVYARAPGVCESRAGVRYCVNHEGDRRRFDQWEGPVQAVLARVPKPVLGPPLVVSERSPKIVSNKDCTPTPAIELLSPRVRALLDPDAAWPQDRQVHPDRSWPWDPECNFDDHGIVLTLQVGSWAVGLPPTQPGTVPPCRADGQARSVLALWLAGQSDPGAPGAIADVLNQSRALGLGAAVGFDWASWPNWGVAWSNSDMALALTLLEQPVDKVARLVGDNWDRLVDPAAPSTELATLAGVDVPAVAGAPVVAGHSHALGPVIELTDALVAHGLPSCP